MCEQPAQFTRSVDDAALVDAVGEIIREAGFDADEHVSTRAFDAAKRRLSGFEHVPTARQISGRLGQRWPDIVAVARGAPGAPRPADAIRAWGRAEENPDLDERNVIFALGLIARELGQDTLTPDEYEQRVQVLLHAGRRDGRGHVFGPLLPAAAQIVRLAGDWDVALAMAGLRPRSGVQLTAAGQQRAADAWRRAHGTATSLSALMKRDQGSSQGRVEVLADKRRGPRVFVVHERPVDRPRGAVGPQEPLAQPRSIRQGSSALRAAENVGCDLQVIDRQCGTVASLYVLQSQLDVRLRCLHDLDQFRGPDPI